jgi:hypothetical protein
MLLWQMNDMRSSFCILRIPTWTPMKRHIEFKSLSSITRSGGQRGKFDFWNSNMQTSFDRNENNVVQYHKHSYLDRTNRFISTYFMHRKTDRHWISQPPSQPTLRKILASLISTLQSIWTQPDLFDINLTSEEEADFEAFISLLGWSCWKTTGIGRTDTNVALGSSKWN